VTGEPQQGVDLALHCTMGVGGPARYFVEAHDLASVLLAVDWTRRRGVTLRVLGGGSNLLVADDGVDGLVLKVALRGLSVRESTGAVDLTAAAGEPWDDLVRHAVQRGWAGIECLSGIPGLVGATPIQNVGAYGQEVSDTVAAVRVLDRTTSRIVTLGPAACGFAYRDSALKSRDTERYVVLAVTYRLRPGGVPTVTYPDIERHLAGRGVRTPTLGEVRTSVLAVRRSKSMVLDPDDENRRSCGSFFLNPLLLPEAAAQVAERAAAAVPGVTMPSWREPSGRVKLSAAWLIERAGFARGEREGPVGLSSRHTLAIVCHDGARAADVAAFARRVRARVEERFGVRLVPEPVFWGGITLD
jgi:UDP-N-acetylmuramate dehydrogenase